MSVSATSSQQLVDEIVDGPFSETPITLCIIWVAFASVAAAWVVKLEWPQEIVSNFEVRAYCCDFVDKILDAGYVVASKDFLDDSVVCDCSTSAINLYKATFVNKSLDGGNGWETVSDVGLNSAKHVRSGFVNANKYSVVDLSHS